MLLSSLQIGFWVWALSMMDIINSFFIRVRLLFKAFINQKVHFPEAAKTPNTNTTMPSGTATDQAYAELNLNFDGKLKEYNYSEFLPKAFPTLFPYGVGGLQNDLQTTSVARLEHIQHWTMLAKDDFRTHESFFFVVFNMHQRLSSRNVSC